MKRKLSISTREKIRKAHLGLKHSEETKRKIGEGNKKAYRTPEQKLRLSIIMKERMRSLTPEQKAERYNMEWRKKLSRRFLGSNWPKDEKTLKYRIKRNFRYKLWKNSVLERDGFKCTICHSTENLHVHHKIEFDSIITQYKQQLINCDLEIPILWDINNGVTRCRDCHKISHNAHPIWKNRILLFLRKLNTVSDLLPDNLNKELQVLLK